MVNVRFISIYGNITLLAKNADWCLSTKQYITMPFFIDITSVQTSTFRSFVRLLRNHFTIICHQNIFSDISSCLLSSNIFRETIINYVHPCWLLIQSYLFLGKVILWWCFCWFCMMMVTQCYSQLCKDYGYNSYKSCDKL